MTANSMVVAVYLVCAFTIIYPLVSFSTERCTGDQIEKMINAGFSKEEISKLCGSNSEPIEETQELHPQQTESLKDQDTDEEIATLQLIECKRDKKFVVECSLTLTRTGEDSLFTLYSNFDIYSKSSAERGLIERLSECTSTVMFDDHGHEHTFPDATIADTKMMGKYTHNYVKKQLISGVPVNISLKFYDVKPEVQKVALLRVCFSWYEGWESMSMEKVEFRKIPIKDTRSSNSSKVLK